jgi:Xaa-Pro aminopeptidase
MERDEALATGLEVRLTHEFSSKPDDYEELYANMLRELGAGKSIAIFGNVPFQIYHSLSEGLERRGWRLHRSRGEDLIQLARKRKEPWELDAIRSAGERTEQIVDGVRALLREAERGRAMTIGDLKAFVSQEIARLGMIEDHETILSQDATPEFCTRAETHAAADVRPAGPRHLSGGQGERLLLRPHAHVLHRPDLASSRAFTPSCSSVYARDAMRPGTPAAAYQALVCSFSSRGFPRSARIRSRSKATSTAWARRGLDIHEQPRSRSGRKTSSKKATSSRSNRLYFPIARSAADRDTFVVTADGVETLCRELRAAGVIGSRQLGAVARVLGPRRCDTRDLRGTEEPRNRGTSRKEKRGSIELRAGAKSAAYRLRR